MRTGIDQSGTPFEHQHLRVAPLMHALQPGPTPKKHAKNWTHMQTWLCHRKAAGVCACLQEATVHAHPAASTAAWP